ncbi:hypothetical protein DFH06DRAFT_1400174 [Mycena polygramma]|nr:hypothetical protein DFH06DRAFT_1400174 [Mycena polygramma]
MLNLAQEVSTKDAKGARRNITTYTYSNITAAVPIRRSSRDRGEASWRRISVGKGPSQTVLSEGCGVRVVQSASSPAQLGARERAPLLVTDWRRGRWQGLERASASITRVELNEVELVCCRWMSGWHGQVLEKIGRTKKWAMVVGRGQEALAEAVRLTNILKPSKPLLSKSSNVDGSTAHCAPWSATLDAFSTRFTRLFPPTTSPLRNLGSLSLFGYATTQFRVSAWRTTLSASTRHQNIVQKNQMDKAVHPGDGFRSQEKCDECSQRRVRYATA